MKKKYYRVKQLDGCNIGFRVGYAILDGSIGSVNSMHGNIFESREECQAFCDKLNAAIKTIVNNQPCTITKPASEIQDENEDLRLQHKYLLP